MNEQDVQIIEQAWAEDAAGETISVFFKNKVQPKDVVRLLDQIEQPADGQAIK